MIEIGFAGNASINTIKRGAAVYPEVPGGAAPTAGYVAGLLTDSASFALAPLGSDYPCGRFAGRVAFPPELVLATGSNRFEVDEDAETFLLTSGSYLRIPDGFSLPQFRHLHLSCRAGVDVARILRSERWRSLSADVMHTSMGLLRAPIQECLRLADVFFCNRRELELLRELRLQLPPSLVVVVTSADSVGVYQAGTEVVSLPTIPLGRSSVLSTTGAGDCFAGGFLAGLAKGGSLTEAVCVGIAAATASVKGIGVLHVVDGPGLWRVAEEHSRHFRSASWLTAADPLAQVRARW